MSRSDSIFLLVVASLPIQLSKFFFVESSFVLGIPIDYLAPSIYLIDVFLIIYLVVFLFENRSKLGQIYEKYKMFINILLFFNITSLANVLLISFSQPSSAVPSIKIFAFSLFSLAAATTLSKKRVQILTSYTLVFSVLWQTALILAQFIFQRSQGFWFLGERSFDTTTVSIAHITLFGVQLLRPYGTFPHPNVTGAFFTVSLLFIFLGKHIHKRLKVAALIAGFLSLSITFSKSAILALITAFIFASKSPWILTLKLITLAALVLLLLRYFPETQIASIAERIALSQAALDIALEHLLFGIGTGNFIRHLTSLDLYSVSQVRLLQPVHNVFLLILAENGIIGLILFGTLLFVVLRHATSTKKVLIMVSLLIFASADHFLWTLEQGQLLFWFAIATVLAKE